MSLSPTPLEGFALNPIGWLASQIYKTVKDKIGTKLKILGRDNNA